MNIEDFNTVPKYVQGCIYICLLETIGLDKLDIEELTGNGVCLNLNIDNNTRGGLWETENLARLGNWKELMTQAVGVNQAKLLIRKESDGGEDTSNF